MKNAGKTNVALITGISGSVLALGVLTFFVMIPPSLARAKKKSQEGRAAVLVLNLDLASESYRADRGGYPDDAQGSGSLSRGLSQPGMKDAPYYQFRPEDLDSQGNVRNPVHPETEFVQYRNNSARLGDDSLAHNKAGVDLWCKDADGLETGLRNWE